MRRRVPFATATRLLHLLLVALATVQAGAQQPTRLSLSPANGSLSEEFSNVTWVRELGDGRVIVSDGREGRIVVADLRAGKVEQISRRGEGPGEYPRALPVWSVGRDSSILIDSPRRWLMFDGVRIVATLAPDAAPVAALRGLARGADEVGSVYSAAFLPGAGRPIGDSTALLRVARSTAKVDTLTKLEALVPRRSGAPTSPTFAVALPTLDAVDEAVPFADGWVAVVRSEPYRVEWMSPDGRWTRGAPLPFRSIRVDDKEKRAYMTRIASATGRTPSPPDSITDWPSTLPPYRSPVALLASPDGRLLIPRLPTADALETRYDVVNRRGALDGQLVLPSNERVVGFGRSAVYIAVTDNDGIQRIRRHQWPTA